MQQKVVKIGNSLGVIIPKQVKNTLNIKEGDKVIVEENPYDNSVIIRKQNSSSVSSITPEFVSIVNKVNKKYKKALQKLANEE